MMCHSIGLPPISTIGFGRTAVSSLSREPKPPARITAFIVVRLEHTVNDLTEYDLHQ
jgi:hypothetical protein